MAKKYSEEEITHVRRTLISVHCDKCGDKIKLAPYEVAEFELKYKTGESFPSGGYGEVWQVEDLCGRCAAELKELVIQWGATVTDKEWDW